MPAPPPPLGESSLTGITRRWKWPVRLALALSLPALLHAQLWPALISHQGTTISLVCHAASLLSMFALQAGSATLLLALLAYIFRDRRWALYGLILAFVWLAPDLWSQRPRSTTVIPPGADRLTILSVNALYGSLDPAKLRAAVDDSHADVILIQEYTHACADRVKAALHEYPFVSAAPDTAAFGQAVFSKRPLLKEARFYPPPPWNWPEAQIEISVTLAGAPVRITNIHLLSPGNLHGILGNRAQTNVLSEHFTQDLAAPAHQECILAGDFNSTPRGHIIQAFLAAGFHDSWSEVNPGRGGTWPAITPAQYLGKIRLDNILHTAGLRCIGAGIGSKTGSDHLPTWATFVREPLNNPAVK